MFGSAEVRGLGAYGCGIFGCRVMGQSSPQLGLGFLGLKGLICFLRVLAGLMAESMAQVSTWAQAIELEGRARFVGFFSGRKLLGVSVAGLQAWCFWGGQDCEP